MAKIEKLSYKKQNQILIRKNFKNFKKYYLYTFNVYD